MSRHSAPFPPEINLKISEQYLNIVSQYRTNLDNMISCIQEVFYYFPEDKNQKMYELAEIIAKSNQAAIKAFVVDHQYKSEAEKANFIKIENIDKVQELLKILIELKDGLKDPLFNLINKEKLGFQESQIQKMKEILEQMSNLDGLKMDMNTRPYDDPLRNRFRNYFPEEPEKSSPLKIYPTIPAEFRDAFLKYISVLNSCITLKIHTEFEKTMDKKMQEINKELQKEREKKENEEREKREKIEREERERKEIEENERKKNKLIEDKYKEEREEKERKKNMEIEYKRLKDEMNSMREENERFKEENERFKEENIRFKEENERFKEEKISMIKENERLKNEMKSMKDENKRSKEKIESFEKEMANSEKNKKLEETIESLNKQVKQCTTENESLKAKETGFLTYNSKKDEVLQKLLNLVANLKKNCTPIIKTP